MLSRALTRWNPRLSVRWVIEISGWIYDLSLFYLLGIYAYIVLREDDSQFSEEELAAELRGMVKTRITSFAQPDKILVNTAVISINVLLCIRKILDYYYYLFWRIRHHVQMCMKKKRYMQREIIQNNFFSLTARWI